MHRDEQMDTLQTFSTRMMHIRNELKLRMDLIDLQVTKGEKNEQELQTEGETDDQ